MARVAVVGGSGYTGVELLRLLLGHPEVELFRVTSRQEAGWAIGELYPSLAGLLENRFTKPKPELLAEADVVFFATPNGTAMRYAEALLERGVLVIDLAADFRLKDPDLWRRWYGGDHVAPHLLEKAVYGLPERYRDRIQRAELIANPGCYPTAVQLGLLPLVESGLIGGRVVADCKSGASGAGRKAEPRLLMSECGEQLSAYAASGHRHLPEIVQELGIELTFVPHLVPMVRGLHATLYVPLKAPSDLSELQALYEARYAPEPFVQVLPPGSHPGTGHVRGSNRCLIALHQLPESPEQLIVLAVIDNLIKGAAGQAIQNMNLALGLPETMGLPKIALFP